MEDNETCNECNGERISASADIARIEIPESYMADKLGREQIFAASGAMAFMARDATAQTRVDSSEYDRGADHQSRTRFPGQVTLADTRYAEVLACAPPRELASDSGRKGSYDGALPVGGGPVFPEPPIVQPSKHGTPIPKGRTLNDLMDPPTPASLQCGDRLLFRTTVSLTSAPQDVSVDGTLPPLWARYCSTPTGKTWLRAAAETAARLKAQDAIADALATGELPGTWDIPVMDALKSQVAERYEGENNPCVGPCWPEITILSYDVATDPILTSKPDIRTLDQKFGDKGQAIPTIFFFSRIRDDGWLEFTCVFSFYYVVRFDITYSLVCVASVEREERF